MNDTQTVSACGMGNLYSGADHAYMGALRINEHTSDAFRGMAIAGTWIYEDAINLSVWEVEA
jgi:hypothetical protein